MADYPLFSPTARLLTNSVNTNSPHSLTIASLTSRRVVRLDPFIESFNFKVSKKTEFKKFDAVNSEGGVIEEPSEISISLTMNVPAAGVGDATRNKQKIQELQRMINPDIGSKNNTAILMVHMKNLIARIPSVTASESFDSCLANGLPCHISSIDYSPDFEAGFILENLPKNIKLSLELKVINQMLNLSQNGNTEEHDFRFAHSFVDNGMYQSMDTKGFPFGFFQFSDFEKNYEASQGSDGEIKSFEPQQMSNLNSKSDTFIMFTNHILEKDIESSFPEPSDEVIDLLQTVFDNLASDGRDIPTEVLLPDEFAKRQSANQNVKIPRWVTFEPFMEEMNRTVEVQHITKKIGEGAFSTGYESTIPKLVKFSLTFDVLASTLEEAQINMARLNTLFRLSAAPTKEKFMPRQLIVVPERKTGYAKTIKVLIPGFIQKTNNTIKKNTTINLKKRNELLPYCVDLHVYSIDFDINDDLGFFEDGGALLPKAYKVKVELYSTDTGIKNEAKYPTNKTQVTGVPQPKAEPKSKAKKKPAEEKKPDPPKSPPIEQDPVPVSYTLTRLVTNVDRDGPVPPNLHLFDINGDQIPDVVGSTDPALPGVYVNFSPAGLDPEQSVIDAVKQITATRNPGGDPVPVMISPGQQTEINIPESLINNKPPDGATSPQPTDPQIEGEAPGGEPSVNPDDDEVGTGTEKSDSSGAGSADDPQGGTTGGGYYGPSAYDEDFAY